MFLPSFGANVNVLPENNPDKLRTNLIDQVTGTVRWRETMEFAEKNGIKKIIELGVFLFH